MYTWAVQAEGLAPLSMLFSILLQFLLCCPLTIPRVIKELSQIYDRRNRTNCVDEEVDTAYQRGVGARLKEAVARVVLCETPLTHFFSFSDLTKTLQERLY